MHIAPKRTKRKKPEGKGEGRGEHHKVKKPTKKIEAGKGNRAGCPMSRQTKIDHSGFGEREGKKTERYVDPEKFPKLVEKIKKLCEARQFELHCSEVQPFAGLNDRCEGECI